MIELTPEKIRVLGALAEKELTTPEYYPLTLKALANACNQKTSRNPVVTYDEDVVFETVQSLIDQEFIRKVWKSDSRVPKYSHRLREVLHLNDAQLSLFTLLLLRGAQTVGELRSRSHRMYEFDDLAQVGEYLDQMGSKRDQPLVQLLQRIPGQKEARYTHLLGSESDRVANEMGVTQSKKGEDIHCRISELEGDVAALKSNLEELIQAFNKFKKQFD